MLCYNNTPFAAQCQQFFVRNLTNKKERRASEKNSSFPVLSHDDLVRN